MEDKKVVEQTMKTPEGNEYKAVEKKNILQKAGDGIHAFCDKHQKGVKWAKRGILAVGGALLFGAGCKVGSRKSDSDSDVIPADAEFVDTEDDQYSTTIDNSEE